MKIAVSILLQCHCYCLSFSDASITNLSRIGGWIAYVGGVKIDRSSTIQELLLLLCSTSVLVVPTVQHDGLGVSELVTKIILEILIS